MGWDPGPRTSMQSITGLYTWKTLPLPYVWTFLAFTCSHDDKSKVLLRHDGHYICVEILAIHSSLCWTLMVNGYIGTVLTKQKFWFVVAAACIGTNREQLLIRHRGCMYRQYKWTCSWMGNFLLWPKYMKHIFNRMLGSLSEPRALYHCNYLHPEILYPKQLGLLLPVVAPILNCTRVRLETLVRSIFCSDWYIRCIKYWTQFFVVFQVLGISRKSRYFRRNSLFKIIFPKKPKTLSHPVGSPQSKWVNPGPTRPPIHPKWNAYTGTGIFILYRMSYVLNIWIINNEDMPGA